MLVSQDTDLLSEATQRQREGRAFVGVVYAHPLRISIGRCIQDLVLIAKVCTLAEMTNQVLYLPL